MLTDWDPRGRKHQSNCEITERQVAADLRAIAGTNGGSYAGCWDVFAWRGDERLFVDAKRAGKDRIRKSQLRWLEAAVSTGVSLDSFLIVEWKFG